MDLVQKLKKIWNEQNYPFLIENRMELFFSDILKYNNYNISNINSGDVVALIGDFNPMSISLFLRLIDMNTIIVPLTNETSSQHDYFFKTALVDVVIKEGDVKRLNNPKKHRLINELRHKNNPGLILFSTGTTGKPKAILHDLSIFLKRFETPRPTLRTLNFLLFDHIGGINTLLHTLFNKGVVIVPKSRSVKDVLDACNEHKVEVLPTTPTFLRMLLFSNMIPQLIPPSIKIITYGTERMDQITLDELCKLIPNVDFRQTFGMSELGIVRVKSRSRDSLFMKIGGEGIETRIINNVLEIRSSSRMLGYLNAELPFDKDGWYNTSDIVEESDGFYKVTGRTSEVINVGGLKFMASEIEKVALSFPNIELAKVIGKDNPITGQHVELTVQPKEINTFDKLALKHFLKDKLSSHMMPRKIILGSIKVGHRFKRE